MTSLPSPYSVIVKLAQEILNFQETNKGSLLFRYLHVRDDMESWVAAIRKRAALVRNWGYVDAASAQRSPDEIRMAYLSDLLLQSQTEDGEFVLLGRPEVIVGTGDYEVYKRGACQALNLDPHTERPLRAIYAEDREK